MNTATLERPRKPATPPPTPPADDTYAFPVGTCVSHESQPMPSLVMCRIKSSKGKECRRAFVRVRRSTTRPIDIGH